MEDVRWWCVPVPVDWVPLIIQYHHDENARKRGKEGGGELWSYPYYDESDENERELEMFSLRYYSSSGAYKKGGGGV